MLMPLEYIRGKGLRQINSRISVYKLGSSRRARPREG